MHLNTSLDTPSPTLLLTIENFDSKEAIIKFGLCVYLVITFINIRTRVLTHIVDLYNGYKLLLASFFWAFAEFYTINTWNTRSTRVGLFMHGCRKKYGAVVLPSTSPFIIQTIHPLNPFYKRKCPSQLPPLRSISPQGAT